MKVSTLALQVRIPLMTYFFILGSEVTRLYCVLFVFYAFHLLCVLYCIVLHCIALHCIVQAALLAGKRKVGWKRSRGRREEEYVGLLQPGVETILALVQGSSLLQ